MAGGILSANDAGSYWRTAASDEAEKFMDQQMAEHGLTSQPPQGASTSSTTDSAGQGVTIPNSNKFKTPANSLKKLLDTIPPDDAGIPDHSHPGLSTWLTTPSNAAFAKTYFKPGNKALLQHVLGSDNYGKLIQHAPLPHSTALTTHQQKPAPNSNKYKTPTNGLSKVLHGPGATPKAVKGWLDAHPDYVKGYLTNPEYQDAIEGDLGTGAYQMLQEHLKSGVPMTPGETVKKNVEQAFQGTPFQPQTQEQALAPEPGSPMDKPAPQGLGDKAKAINPNLSGSTVQKLNEGDPDTIKAFEGLVQSGSYGSFTEPLQKMLVDHYADQPKPKNPFAELLKNYPTPKGQVTEDQHGEPVAPANSAHYDQIQQKADKPGFSQSAKELISHPAFHEWFHSHTKDKQAEFTQTPATTALVFQKWLAKHPGAGQGVQPLAPEDQAEADKVKELIPQIQQATPPSDVPPVDEWESKLTGEPVTKAPSAEPPPGVDSSNSQHPAIAEAIKKVFPNANVDGHTDDEMKTQLESWLKYLPEHKGDQDFSSHVPQLQKIYDQFFGQGPKGPSGPSPAVPPAASGSPDKHQDLLDKINQIAPGWIKKKEWLQKQEEQGTLEEAMGLWGKNTGMTPDQQQAFQKLHDDYFGDKSESQSGQSDELSKLSFGDFAATVFPSAFGKPGGSYAQKFDNYPPEKQKSTLKGWIDSKQGEQTGELDKLKAYYDQKFGKPSAGVGPQYVSLDNFKAFLKEMAEQGLISKSLAEAIGKKQTPEKFQSNVAYVKEQLANGSTGYADTGWPAIVKAWDQAHGTQQAAPAYDQDQAKNDWLDIYSGDVDKFSQQMSTPEQAKAYAEQILSTAPPIKKAKVQAWLDKHFGGATGGVNSHYQLAVDSASVKGSLKDKVLHSPAFQEWFHQLTPEDQQKYVNDMVIHDGGISNTSYVTMFKNPDNSEAYKKALEQAQGGLTADPDAPTLSGATKGTGLAPGPHTPEDMLAPDGSYSQQAVDYLKQSGWGVPGSDNAHQYWDDADWAQVVDKPLGHDAEALNWKDFKAQSGAGTKGYKPTDAQIEEAAEGTGISAEVLKNMSEADWKHAYESAQKPGAANNFWKKMGPVVEQNLGIKSGPPPFDSDAFKTEYGALFPGSGWHKTEEDKSPEEAEQKLKSQVQNADDNYPDTEKTQQAHALYEKYFGGGKMYAPKTSPKTPGGGLSSDVISQIKANAYVGAYGGDWGNLTSDQQQQKLENLIEEHQNEGYGPEAQVLQTIYDQYFGQGAGGEAYAPPKPETLSGPKVPTEPEEDQGVSPSKSEPATPEEVTTQAGAKPATGTDFKNFAKWWGAKQLSPEDEATIYHAWFPHKAQATPEQAGKWFQAVFEHYSKPGTDDLTAEGMPQWAANSWALGKDAEAQWPMFKQWASSDPGIPKGTSIKAKLAIWKSLSEGDKKELAENYNPAHPVDTNSLVGELAKAYPDSDWKTWASMPQGTLKNNVEMLAKAGYAKAVPVYNKFYGGHLPVPTETEAAEQAAANKPIPLIPVHKLPDWVQNTWGTSQSASALYTGLKNMADAIGKGDLAEKGNPDSYHGTPNDLVKLYNGTPQWLKDQIASTPAKQLPFHSEEEYKTWLAAQPTPKQVFAGVDGIDTEGYVWNQPLTGSYGTSQKSYVEKALQKMADSPSTDPAVFAKTLNDYNMFWGGNKPTLAQGLKDVYPEGPASNGGLKKDGADWDTYLKTHSKADVAKLIKKQFKNEPDPEKWIKLVDLWPKYIGGNTGHGKLTPVMNNVSSGKGVGADTLKALKYWKEHGANPNDSLPAYWQIPSEYEPGDYIKGLGNTLGSQPGAMYYGWTPPGHQGGGYVADPALLGSSGIKTYTAPATAEKKGKQYQSLLDKITKNSAAYSQVDKDLATSEEFAGWFQQAPSSYKEAFQHNPGIALDDFKAFTQGNLGTSEVPEGDGQNHYYDLNPQNLVPKATGPETVPGGGNYKKNPFWKANPQQSTEVKFPRAEDEQETIPLPAGQQWAPKYNSMPVYRTVSLTGLWSKDQNPDREKVRKQIVGIIEGSGSEGVDNQPTLFSDESFQKDWAKDVPTSKPSGDADWMQFANWASKHHVPGEQMYDLAKKWGFSNPEQYGAMPLSGTKGNFEDPRLAKLLLDYMTMGSSGHSQEGGLGIHWTRSRGKGYTPAGSVLNASQMKYIPGQQLPVTYSGLWNGQGEDPNMSGGAYSPSSPEQELTLLTGAPVHMRRLQIRGPQDDWHDLMDYGPISLWPKGRDERFIPGSGSNALGYIPTAIDDPKTKESLDKPSLAATLTKMVGKNFGAKKADDPHSGPEFWDKLTPGPVADQAFAQLLKEHPTKEKELQKVYRWFFVGRPDLEVKPHFRTANLRRTLRTIEADFETLAAEDWEDGYGGEDPDVWAHSAPSALKSPLFPAHQSLSGDDDGKRPRIKTHEQGDRNTDHFFFSPHEVNPKPDTNARPNVEFPKEQLPQDTLPDMPTGHGDVPLHRGYAMDVEKNSPLRRAMDQYDPEDPRVRDLLLEHLGQQGVYYGPHEQFDLGSHWTTDKDQADRFAENTDMGEIPVSVSTGWHGTGEDPYRSDTFGDYPSEHEVTLLPGAKAPVSSVRYRSPKSGMWHEFKLDKPVDRVASIEAMLLEAEIEGLVDPKKMWNNFGELDTHHPGTGAGMLGHDGPPVQHKKMWQPKKLKDVEAAIERLAMADMYHFTNSPDAIYRDKKFKSRGGDPYAYFTTNPDSGYAKAFGSGRVHLDVPDELFNHETGEWGGGGPNGGHIDENGGFGDEQFWAIPKKRIKPEWFVPREASSDHVSNAEDIISMLEDM